MNLEQIKAQLTDLQQHVAALEAPRPHRLFHVQVAGSPSMDDLRNIRDLFQQSLDDGVDRAVPTDMRVVTRVYALTPEQPVTGLVVQGCVSVEAVAATAYAALCGLRALNNIKVEHDTWAKLSIENRTAFANSVLEYLNTGVTPQSWAGTEKLVVPVVESLRPLLPTPLTDNLEVEALHSEVLVGGQPHHKWQPVDLRNLTVGMIFRFKSDRSTCVVAASPPFINYGAAPGAEWAVRYVPKPDTFVLHPELAEGQEPDAPTDDAEVLHSEGVAQAEASELEASREPANAQDASDLDGTVADSYAGDREPDLEDTAQGQRLIKHREH